MNLQNWVAIAESGRVQREQKMELALKELGLISHEGLCIEECKTLCKALQIKWNGTITIKKCEKCGGITSNGSTRQCFTRMDW